MVALQERRQIARSIADCFRYLSDFSTIEQWDPGVYRAEKTSPGKPMVGTEFDLILNSAGQRVPMRYRIEKLSAPQNGVARIELSGEGERFAAYDVIELRAESDSVTAVDYRAELTFTGAMAAVVPLLKPWLDRVGKQAVDGMQTALTLQPTVRPLSAGQRLAYKTVAPAARYFTQAGYLRMPHKGLNEYIDGKTVVVTGPTAGLGLAASCELARLGAKVVLVGRDIKRLARAQTQVAEFAGVGIELLPTYEVDMLDMAAVRQVASRIAEEQDNIDVLVNNAGALFADRQTTEQGYERALAVDLLAPWIFTEALLPALRQSQASLAGTKFAKQARVINVVSGGMYLQPLVLNDLGFENEPYDGSKAYARAKRGLMAATEHWAASEPSIHFSAMHPGWAATPGVEKSLPAFNRKMAKRLRDSRMGADTIVWLASSQAPLDQDAQLWFDRQVVPTEVFAKTKASSEQKSQLLTWLQQEAAKFE